MKLRKLLLIPFILLLLTACSEDSALSDVEINDPSLLRPEAKMYHMTDTSGTATTSYQVWIYDKNDDGVELKNGSVRLNGIRLALGRTGINSVPYYYMSPPSLLNYLNDSSYIFGITLSDGTLYEFEVTTQSSFIDSFKVPATQVRTDDMLITWGPVDATADTLVLERYVNYDGADGNGFQYNWDYIPNTGSYTIPASVFTAKDGTESIELRLISIKNGTVPAGFRDGAEVQSRISSEAYCQITD